MNPLPAKLEARVAGLLGGPANRITSVGGGDVNSAARWDIFDGRSAFIKWRSGADPRVFQTEAEGLAELGLHSGIPVPEVLLVSDDPPALVLSWFDGSVPAPEGWKNLGTLLAAQHGVTAESYGLEHHNYIGRLPQSNTPTANWETFWTERRLMPLAEQGRRSGIVEDRLYERIEALARRAAEFSHETLRPSLLHGDLWSGNLAFTSPTEPIIFDPAVYYGDREVEMAFTELFGGFPAAFYEAYQAAWPLDPGYEGRRPYWQLYPLLVHCLMFGASYVGMLERAIGQAEDYVR